MKKEVPTLIPLDPVIPNLDGTAVIERMHANTKLRQIPVILLSNEVSNLEDIGGIEDYISRVFIRELNISPWGYLNRYRVLQSKQMLKNTTNTIGSIAKQVGFKDQTYFGCVFHKITAVSPQGFRNKGLIVQ